MIRMLAILLLVGFGSFALAKTLAAVDTSTGPGCPGDPTWLGWCSEIRQVEPK